MKKMRRTREFMREHKMKQRNRKLNERKSNRRKLNERTIMDRPPERFKSIGTRAKGSDSPFVFVYVKLIAKSFGRNARTVMEQVKMAIERNTFVRDAQHKLRNLVEKKGYNKGEMWIFEDAPSDMNDSSGTIIMEYDNDEMRLKQYKHNYKILKQQFGIRESAKRRRRRLVENNDYKFRFDDYDWDGDDEEGVDLEYTVFVNGEKFNATVRKESDDDDYDEWDVYIPAKLSRLVDEDELDNLLRIDAEKR